MTDTNQKLREVLQAISHIDDTTNHSVDASAALDRIGQIARQALALPTADHLPDAGKMVVDHFPDATKMIETAEPMGERERFEAYFAWSRKNKGANRRPNFERFEEDGTYKDDHTQRHWWTWQQALSAGEAVDAQRLDFLDALCSRPASSDMHMRNGSVALYVRTGIGAQLAAQGQGKVRDAIDAAMRKDKP